MSESLHIVILKLTHTSQFKKHNNIST